MIMDRTKLFTLKLNVNCPPKEVELLRNAVDYTVWGSIDSFGSKLNWNVELLSDHISDTRGLICMLRFCHWVSGVGSPPSNFLLCTVIGIYGCWWKSGWSGSLLSHLPAFPVILNGNFYPGLGVSQIEAKILAVLFRLPVHSRNSDPMFLSVFVFSIMI